MKLTREEVTGWKLAMRVLQSDLYRQLDDAEKAECDYLAGCNPMFPKNATPCQSAGAVASHEYDATGLLPCPFCNDAAIYGKTDDEGRFVTCVNLGCLASTNVRYACGDDPLPILAEQWNRRAGMLPPKTIWQPNEQNDAVQEGKQ